LPHHAIHPPFWQGLKHDPFFWLLLAVCGVFSVMAPQRIAQYPQLVDWHTIAALAGLLILTKAVESSGMLQLLGQRLIDAVESERVLALALVGASAALSTLLTNDVALFVIVPLTVGLRHVARLPVTRLIVFEALAVNAGSALTPIGNPQNLFLWHQSGLSFGADAAVAGVHVVCVSVTDHSRACRGRSGGAAQAAAAAGAGPLCPVPVADRSWVSAGCAGRFGGAVPGGCALRACAH
jgi:di/tricarboxylate transporter